MNHPYRLLLAIPFLCLTLHNAAQCTDVPVADPSFEEGTFDQGNMPGFWYRNDGAELSTNVVFDGIYALCSNGGGAEQSIAVQANTEYFLSCYIKNGVNDPFLSFIIQNIYVPVEVASNDWTLTSLGFNSGADTLIGIGVYSSAACFDAFSLTCDSLITETEALSYSAPFRLYPTLSAEHFTLETTSTLLIEVFDLSGNLVEKKQAQQGKIDFGHQLPPALYVVRLSSKKKVWARRILKM